MAPKAKAEAKAKPEAKPKAEKKAPKKEEEDIESKLPKVEQPDKKVFDQKSQELQDQIDEAQRQLKEVKDKIGERTSGNSEFQKQRSALRAQIQEETEKIDAFMAKKDEIRGQMGLKNEENKKLRTEMNDMKKSLKYDTVEKIDDRIGEIEAEMRHSSLTLKQEKEYMKEIAQLKKDKPKVERVKSMDETVTAARGMNDTSTLREQLDAIGEAMMKHREKKKELNEQYTELMKQRDEQMGDSQEWFEKRDKLNEKVRDLIHQRNALRETFREEERAYYEYQKEIRNLRWEKQRAEREEKQKQWESERRQKEADKLEDQPYVHETTLLEQTIKFCKSFQAKEEVKVEETKKIDMNEKGLTMLQSKDQRDEEFYFAPTAKKGKGSKKKDKPAGSSKPIKHNAETFKLFGSLKIEAPITTDDIPATLEKLQEEMEKYQAKIKEWEKKKDERKKAILEHGEYKDEEGEEEKAEEKEEEKTDD